MKKTGAWRAIVLPVVIILVGIFVTAFYPHDTTERLLVPWMETSLASDNWTSTIIRVSNDHPEPVNVVFTIYSNLGVPVLPSRLFPRNIIFELPGKAIKQINFRELFTLGILPDGTTLNEEDREVLRRMLRGEVVDGYRYGTETPNPTAFAIFTATFPDSKHTGYLVGDFSLSSPSGEGEKDRLVRLTTSCEPDDPRVCVERRLHFLHNDVDRFTRFFIWQWNGVPRQPFLESNPLPLDLVSVTAYTGNGGVIIKDLELRLPAVSFLAIPEHFVPEELGSVEFSVNSKTGIKIFVEGEYIAIDGCTRAIFSSSCTPPDPEPTPTPTCPVCPTPTPTPPPPPTPTPTPTPPPTPTPTPTPSPTPTPTPTPKPNPHGCSPGYWKNHQFRWVGLLPSQRLTNVFGEANHYASLRDVTLIYAFEMNGSPAERLAHHAVPALLNANYNREHPEFGYPLSPSQVVDQVNNAFTSGNATVMENLKDELDRLNNLGCPLN